MKNITAFTETHVTTPGYISINADNNDSELNISITLRSRGRDGFTGNGASIELSAAELVRMANDILAAYPPVPVAEVEPVKSSKK